MSECLSPAQLEALVREPPGHDHSAHLASCTRCQARVERARADLALWNEARQAARGLPRTESCVIPGYRIERELRRGGQGVVYLADQEGTHRRVALKMLIGGSAARATDRRRFEREVELASRLHHPRIVTVFDSGTVEGAPWYAMEYVEGTPLDEWVRERQPSLRTRVEIFAQLCSAVAYAHRHGVIHRDLKPDNVVVDDEGVPHVLDFGAALAAEDDGSARETAPGEFLGTLAYAAPEQLRGDGREIDTRTDVHALGLMLYELLTGELPRPRGLGVAGIVEGAALDTRPPSRIAPGVPRDLDAIAGQALEHDPARRYGSAEALARDLERHLAGDVVEARAHSAWYVLRRNVARRRGTVLAGAAVLVLAGVLGVAWLREHQRADEQREQAGLVRTLFQDILGAASPQRMGGDVRLLEVYQMVARDIDAALRDAPDVQATVELTIGETYRRLLRAPEAIVHLDKALARFRAIAGSQLDVARCADLLSLSLSNQSDPRAIPVAEEALALRLRALGNVDPDVARSRRTLAIALVSQFRDQDLTRARELLLEAQAALVDAYGDDHPEVAETKYWRAQVGYGRSSLDEGALLQEALATLERHAPQDPRTIRCLNSYAAWLEDHARFDEARALLDRSVVLTRQLFGDALTTDMLRRYARLEFARGDLRNAELLSRQAIASELERWAARRPDDAARLSALAQRLQQPGSPAAEVPFAEAFAELRRLEGDGSFELAQWMNGVAATLRCVEDRAPVEAILREALQIRCRALGRDCTVRQRTIQLFAEEQLARGSSLEAVELLEESLATYRRRGDETSADFQHASELLAACRETHAATQQSSR